MNDSLIIIPTYNEKPNIQRLTEKIFSLEKEFDILIVDDHSPDGTAAIVISLMEKYKERLFLLERPGKLGLGTAYIMGFRWGLEKKYDFIFQFK